MRNAKPRRSFARHVLLTMALLSLFGACASDACRDSQSGAGALFCGGEGTAAPAGEETPAGACNLRRLLPHFFLLLDQGDLAPLRTVVAALGEENAIEGAPLPNVLDLAFYGLRLFANDAPECSDSDPGCIADSRGCLDLKTASRRAEDTTCSDHGPNAEPGRCNLNRLCETRRALDLSLKQDSARNILDKLRPLTVKILRYFEGKLPGETGPHYDDLGAVLRLMAQNTGPNSVCDPHHFYGLAEDLLISQTPQLAALQLTAVHNVLADPDLNRFLGDFTTSKDNTVLVSRDAFIQLAQLLTKIIIEQDPRDTGKLFDSIEGLMTNVVYPFIEKKYPGSSLESDLKTLVAAARATFATKVGPDMLRHIQAQLNCMLTVDKNGDIPGAIYDLTQTESSDQAALALELVDAISSYWKEDSQGGLARMTVNILRSVNNPDDDRAVDAISRLVQKSLDKNLLPTGLPVVETLIDRGVMIEFLTLADNLLYGCKQGAL